MTAQILWLLITHWVGDFVFQTHWQAVNKSKNLEALIGHVLIYMLTLLVGVGLILPVPQALVFMMVNGLLHFFTDYCTSKWSAMLWQKGDVHNFFVVVGLDQLIHQITLILTFWVIVYQ